MLKDLDDVNNFEKVFLSFHANELYFRATEVFSLTSSMRETL